MGGGALLCASAGPMLATVSTSAPITPPNHCLTSPPPSHPVVGGYGARHGIVKFRDAPESSGQIGPAGRLGPGAHVGEWLGLRPVDHRLQGYERAAAVAAASGREGGPGVAAVARIQAQRPGAALRDHAIAQQTLD